MKFLDSFVNQSFQKDDDGNELFFPWGVLGKGYVLDSLEIKQKIQKFIRLYFGVTFLFLVLWVIAIKPYSYIVTQINRSSVSDSVNTFLWVELPILFIFMLGSLFWWYIGIHPLIKKLPTTTVMFELIESQRASAKALYPVILWSGAIGSLFFLLTGIFFLLQGGRPVAFGWLLIIFFGLTTLACAYKIILGKKP